MMHNLEIQNAAQLALGLVNLTLLDGLRAAYTISHCGNQPYSHHLYRFKHTMVSA